MSWVRRRSEWRERNEAAAAFINVDRLHRADAEFIQANTKYNLIQLGIARPGEG
jgi:hypothetical protein